MPHVTSGPRTPAFAYVNFFSEDAVMFPTCVIIPFQCYHDIVESLARLIACTHSQGWTKCKYELQKRNFSQRMKNNEFLSESWLHVGFYSCKNVTPVSFYELETTLSFYKFCAIRYKRVGSLKTGAAVCILASVRTETLNWETFYEVSHLAVVCSM